MQSSKFSDDYTNSVTKQSLDQYSMVPDRVVSRQNDCIVRSQSNMVEIFWDPNMQRWYYTSDHMNRLHCKKVQVANKQLDQETRNAEGPGPL